MSRFAPRKFLVFVVMAQGLLTGCATVINGPNQIIPVATDPPYADVIVDGQTLGQSPTDITLTRKRDHLVTLAKEGYRQKTIAVSHAIGYAVWGNAIAGGMIGWGIDATTGSQNNLHPAVISVKLEPLPLSRRADISNEIQQRNIVLAMQRVLIRERYYAAQADGYLNPATHAAILKYKNDKLGDKSPTVFDSETLKLFGIQ
jgi:hypothetical protein